MPSPFGHALAGAATAWTADILRGWSFAPRNTSWYERAGGAFTVVCMALAAAPDLDLLLPGTHRTFTHSIIAAVVTGVVTAFVAARKHLPIARVALTCAAAYGSHVLMDWLGVDRYPPRGIQALWPFSRAWYISGVDLFRQTAREHMLQPANIRINALAVAQEAAILLPIVAVLWLIRVKATARLATEVTSGDHAAQ
jgi:membrane-bound metal-dependent hydrolase YbcI (DUF457 family)